ncbi:MAG: carboxypeptidase-like regulatory domain-containing protein, partial [Hymenobacter sp.]
MGFLHRINCLLCFLLTVSAAQAGIIKGRVSGTNNEALAFANVAVRGTATSTGSNDQGQYQLRVPAGQYQLVFQYVGYRPRTETVRVPAGDSTLVLNVALVPESYNLTEVTVRGSDRDPAYAIIQQAQQWRAYHQREVATFQSRLYIKSLIRLSETPSKVFGLFKMGPDIKPGILYLSESLSDIRFTQPNTIKERMISSRVSGDSRGISFNRATGGLNFYDNVLKPSFSQRGFVSPVANNSFLFYQYELVGTTQQGGELVHKIKIIPRRRTDPVFSGFIYIVDGSWRIHSVDVRLTKDAQLDYVDDLHIEQLFAPAPGVPHVWAIQSQKLSVNFSAFGFKGSGYATAVFSNYNHVVATYPAPPEVKKAAGAAPATATQLTAPPVIAPVTTKELTRQIRRQKPDLTGLNKQVRRQVKQARRDSIRNDPFAQMKTGEVMLAEKGVNERDSSYWSQIRPVPLTEEEKQDY